MQDDEHAPVLPQASRHTAGSGWGRGTGTVWNELYVLIFPLIRRNMIKYSQRGGQQCLSW